MKGSLLEKVSAILDEIEEARSKGLSEAEIEKIIEEKYELPDNEEGEEGSEQVVKLGPDNEVTLKIVGTPGPIGPKPEEGKDFFLPEDGKQGPQGEQGPVGPQGPEGKQGPVGPSGPVGPQGPEGVEGSEGKQGPQGPEGKPGENGSPDTGAEIVAKINALPVEGEETNDFKIDWSHIKNAPQFTGKSRKNFGASMFAGPRFVDWARFSESPDDSRTQFTVSNTPIEGSLIVYKNGMAQDPDTTSETNDYAFSGMTVTFTTAPLSTDKLRYSLRF